MKTPTNFRELARVNTGMHMLDSGGGSGRHWQQPAIPEDMPEYYAQLGYLDEPMLLISTAQHFEQRFAIDQRATHHFKLWAQLADPNNNHSWFELADRYTRRMVETGRWEDHGDGVNPFRWNVYNEDNDFDQVFEVIAPSPYSSPFIVMFHNGADVRGGYTPPVVVNGSGYADGNPADIEQQISLWCSECDESAYDLYHADEKGWKFRVNKRSVSPVCPKCHKSGHSWPKFPIRN